MSDCCVPAARPAVLGRSSHGEVTASIAPGRPAEVLNVHSAVACPSGGGEASRQKTEPREGKTQQSDYFMHWYFMKPFLDPQVPLSACVVRTVWVWAGK